MREGYVVAVAGVSGLVGETLLRVLEERRFPIAELRPLGGAHSSGRRVRFAGAELPVAEARPEAFAGADLVFLAAAGGPARTLAPAAAARGAVAIDKSGAWRMEPDVPLVVPEVNADALEGHAGIVASPNCTTVGFALALEPLRRAAGLRSVVVTTFQAASGAGRDGLAELEEQRRGAAAPPRVFPRRIAGNVLPQCETFGADGYTSEERKLLHETRKILGLPGLAVSMTCTRVPVAVGHCAAMLVETERPLAPEAARAALAAFPGVRVVDDPSAQRYPVPEDAAGQDLVLVGRVRRDLGSDRLWLWQAADNLRKGAATNAVQIAEELARRGLLRPARVAR